MDSDEDLDTHICLKCQRTIVGLDNYVAHKRRECPVLLLIRAKPPDHVLISTTTSECTNDASLQPTPPSSNNSSTEQPETSVPVHHCLDHHPQHPHSPADADPQPSAARPEHAFFLSLELQSANRGTAPPNGGRLVVGQEEEAAVVVVTAQPEEAAVPVPVPVPLIPYTSDDVAVLDTFKVAADAFKVIPDSDPIYDTEEEEEDDDPDRPPRGHTGGKWRPASASENSPPSRRPLTPPPVTQPLTPPQGHSDVTTVHRYNTRKTDTRYTLCPRCLNLHPPFSRHCVVPEATSGAGRSSRWVCRPCQQLAFSSEAELVQHLSTPGCRGWTCDGAERVAHVAQVLRLSTRLAPLAPFRCTPCHIYFSRPEDLLNHWSADQPEHLDCLTLNRPFTCSHCSATFHHPTQLHLHLADLLTGTDRRQLRCFIPLVTDAVTSASPSTNGTRRTKPPPGQQPKNSEANPSPYKCRHCAVRFTRRPSLLTHLSSTHTDSMFRCRPCSLTFVRRAEFIRHSSTALHQCYSLIDPSTDTRVSCEQCSFVTRSPSSLLFHRVVQHSGVDRELYSCPQCPDSPPQEPFALRLHLAEHTGEEVSGHHCATCRLVFDQEATLLGHDRSKHGCKNLVCGRCQFRTDRNSKLVEHGEVHREDRSRRFLCETCGAGFYSGAALRSHLSKHFSPRSHVCSVEGCSRAFRFASELAEHQRVHQPQRPFLCDFCGYGAKTRAQLAIHRRQHTRDKRFRCSHAGCDYAATISAHLRRHQLLHTGAKPYRCPHCKYTCNTQENLRKHVLKSKKHLGLPVYPCPHCSFGCNLADDMRRHLADQHQITPTNNEVDSAFASRITGIYRPDLVDTATTTTRGAQIAYVKRDTAATTKRNRKLVTTPPETTSLELVADQVDEVEVTTTTSNVVNHSCEGKVSGGLATPWPSREPKGSVGSQRARSRAKGLSSNWVDAKNSGGPVGNPPPSNRASPLLDQVNEVEITTLVVPSICTQELFYSSEVEVNGGASANPVGVSEQVDAPSSFTVSLLNSSELFRFVDDQQEEIVFTIELPSTRETQVQLFEIVGERIAEEREGSAKVVAVPSHDNSGG